MEIYKQYEEYKRISQLAGWLILITLSLTLVGWALLLHWIIPDAPRQWEFGIVPDTPAETKYSTQEVPCEMPEVPQQFILTEDYVTELDAVDTP